MNIKKVSEQTGVSADTIRYYERIGLLPRAELPAAKERLDYKIENYKNIILKKEESLFEEGTAD